VGVQAAKKLLFNVRSEGIATANFWKDKFATNRCIVPASSFFEWKDSKKGAKSKYEIKVLDREFFGIAEVWAEWRNPKTQKWEKTFATFTSEPNAIMRELHDRQPTSVPQQGIEAVRHLPQEDQGSSSISANDH
jgi:putative SOS response-associated peptidase YedK